MKAKGLTHEIRELQENKLPEDRVSPPLNPQRSKVERGRNLADWHLVNPQIP